MSAFDAPHWNLTQAAAWVVYRTKKLVEEFQRPTQYSWPALKIYPDIHTKTEIGSILDLQAKLENNALKSWGRKNNGTEFEEIPAIEWRAMQISPPIAIKHIYPAGRTEIWTEITLKSADLKRLWPASVVANSREKYDWISIKKLYDDAVKNNPGFGKNQIVVEVQLAFADGPGGKEPSRTAIMRHMNKWTT